MRLHQRTAGPRGGLRGTRFPFGRYPRRLTPAWVFFCRGSKPWYTPVTARSDNGVRITTAGSG